MTILNLKGGFLFYAMMNRPIGIFDSGVGGLSVFQELIAKLPNEDVIYYADSLHCPYGSKSKEEVIKLSEQITDFLLSNNCKIIIIACNTATAAAIDYLREKYSIPFVGMEPAVKPAALNSKTKSIAVLATEGTFNGRLYIETSEKYTKDVRVSVVVGNDLVRIVENNKVKCQDSIRYVAELIQPLIDKNVDQLVLGCTHFPFLTPLLKEVLPTHVNIINPAPAVVAQARRVLQKNNILNPNQSREAEYTFYSSGNKDMLCRMLLEMNLKNIEVTVKKL